MDAAEWESYLRGLVGTRVSVPSGETKTIRRANLVGASFKGGRQVKGGYIDLTFDDGTTARSPDCFTVHERIAPDAPVVISH